MTAADPTGPLAGEWSYGFPNGEPEEGPPQRIPGSTFGADGIAEAVVERAARNVESEGK